jgi:branched-chain amino acid transport system permease protein
LEAGAEGFYSVTLLLQLLLNALALGAAYALIALGFVLVLNATGAVNFAHGEMVMAGGYVAIALAGLVPLPGVALLPAVVLLMAGFGLAFSALAYFPLIRRPPVAVFISTIALGIVLEGGANALFGAEPRAAPALVGSGATVLGGVTLSHQRLAIIALAAALIFLQHLLFAKTQLGRRLRATAQDREMARALGIPVVKMIAATFALGAALASAAGLLLANEWFVTPSAGTNYIVKAYIAVTIGGWGSVPGAVLGALLVAAFEVGVSSVFSYSVASALLYAAVLAILFFRPQGLFGEAAQTRA